MPRLIVAGCGFVGLATARLFQSAGWDVLGLTHSAESAERLTAGGVRALTADISDFGSVRSLARERKPELLIHCASSNRGDVDAYKAVYVLGCENLLEELAPQRFIFTSSTSVYTQTDGSEVTEKTRVDPSSDTGKVLKAAEDLVIRRKQIVARLAGIYGPGRSVLLRKFFTREATIEGDGLRVINQVHRDDIATALKTIAESGEAGMYNVCDDGPMTQRELYEGLARHFELPVPPLGPINPNRKRGWTSKRVSNGKLRALGWAPRYSTFFDAIREDAALVEMAKMENP